GRTTVGGGTMSATQPVSVEDETITAPARRFPKEDIIFWILAIIVAFFLLVPLYVLVKVSLSTVAEANAPHLSYLIHNPTLENWRRLFVWSEVRPPLMHSLIVATGTAILAIVLA